MKGVTVIVIGTGQFGRNYSRILSMLNGEKIPGVPRIDTLIVTKTDLKRAQEMADLLRTQHHETISNVIGAKVCNKKELAALLNQYSPDLTCIVTSDKARGDVVHAEYAAIALKKGKVLCEKPFSNAQGDGASLKLLKDLSAYPNADHFGMELPLVTARQQLLSQDEFKKPLLKTRKFNFHWGSERLKKTDLIDDLALHPWSLIPGFMKTEKIKLINNSETTKKIRGNLYNTREKRKVDIDLTLTITNNFRALEMDGLTLAFQSNGPALNIFQLPYSIKEAVTQNIAYQVLPARVTIHNPLAQHIIASLKGYPIVDLKKTYQSQLFLEVLKGFK